jgi:hypothetical protein
MGKKVVGMYQLDVHQYDDSFTSRCARRPRLRTYRES